MSFTALPTNYGREWNARAAAGENVSPIAEMAFGDGTRIPAGGETALENEVHRVTISNQGLVPDETAAFFDAPLPQGVGGFIIREIGLFTADGKMVAVGTRDPGLPITDPDDLTYRFEVFYDQLDALVVQVDPVHGLTADSLVTHLPWATQAEAADETRENKIIDPKRLWGVLSNLDGSEAGAGLIRFANLQETAEGLLDTKAIHPLGLASVIGGFATPGNILNFGVSGTYSKPANLISLRATLVGGGGGGAVANAGYWGGGGGSAAMVIAYFLDDDLPDTVSVLVGAGGAAQPANGLYGGNAGGSSQFLNMIAGGGGGGQTTAAQAHGLGGAAGTETIAVPGVASGFKGTPGPFGIRYETPSPLGSIGLGGTGGSYNAYGGNSGNNGVVILEEYLK